MSARVINLYGHLNKTFKVGEGRFGFLSILCHKLQFWKHFLKLKNGDSVPLTTRAEGSLLCIRDHFQYFI